MEAFFSQNSSAGCVVSLSTEQFWDGLARFLNTGLMSRIAPNRLSDGYLGENVHAADLGGHPEVGALFLDPDNGRLAADPAFLAGGQFWRED